MLWSTCRFDCITGLIQSNHFRDFNCIISDREVEIIKEGNTLPKIFLINFFLGLSPVCRSIMECSVLPNVTIFSHSLLPLPLGPNFIMSPLSVSKTRWTVIAEIFLVCVSGNHLNYSQRVIINEFLFANEWNFVNSVLNNLFALQMDYLNRFYYGWRDLMDNKSDQRTTDWFLMSSPFPTMAICLAYAYFVKVTDRISDLTDEWSNKKNDWSNEPRVFLDSWTKIDGKQKAVQAEKRADRLQLLPSMLQRVAVLRSQHGRLADGLQLQMRGSGQIDVTSRHESKFSSGSMLGPTELMSDHLLRWPAAAGGTSSASSQNSLTHFSSSCESATTKSPPSTLSTTESCPSAVSRAAVGDYLETDVYFLDSLVGRQVHPWRPLVVLRLRQHGSPHRDVHLLHAGRHGPRSAEVFVVEEVPDSHADDSVHRRHGARLPASLPQPMPVPNRLRLVDRHARLYVLLLVQKLLRPSLQEGSC